MFQRTLKTRLDLLPRKVRHFSDTERGQKCRDSFEIDDLVMVKQYKGNLSTWTPAKITDKIGKIMYRCKLDNGQVYRRHINQIRGRIDRCRESAGEAGGSECGTLGPALAEKRVGVPVAPEVEARDDTNMRVENPSNVEVHVDSVENRVRTDLFVDVDDRTRGDSERRQPAENPVISNETIEPREVEVESLPADPVVVPEGSVAAPCTTALTSRNKRNSRRPKWMNDYVCE